MRSVLTNSEISILANYRFVVAEPEKDVQIDFMPFMDAATMGVYLQMFNKELKAPDLKTAASVFMKRHAFLAVLYLYSMSAFNKKLDVSPGNIVLADAIKDGLWLPEFYLKDKRADVCPAGQRYEWRMEAVRHLFADNLYPVLDAISKSAKISKWILWENVAVYIFWLYEKILSQTEDHEVRARAAEDFSYLVSHAPGKVFGRYSKNPIERYFSEPVYQEETDSYIRIRKTCCLSYMLKEKGGYCKTCPRTCGLDNRECGNG
jgi:ferric iron reductase protein FhuF